MNQNHKENFIPVYQPTLGGNEAKYVNECLTSSWISSRGKFIELFEERFAAYLGTPHAISVSNGTVALHLALLSLGIGPGDEVILPTLTYVACANAIRYTGATPIFVDSLPDSWQMDPKEVVNKLTPHTKAIMAVHLYGHPCNLAELAKLAKKEQIFLLEDCAESLGSVFQSGLTGTFGDIATFSFYGNKTITTGEGGMVITRHTDLFKRCKKLKGQGLANDREYWHDIIGYNYRMTNICAAIGLAQMERIDEILAKKQQIAKAYLNALQGMPLEFHHPVGNVTHSYWMCSVLLNKKYNRDQLRKNLLQAGIETRPLFYPLHTMPIYRGAYEGQFPVAEDLSKRGINLPSWPYLTTEQIQFIAEQIYKSLNTLNKS